MAIEVIKGRYPHIGWVDIEGNGILTEIAIVRNGSTGLFFIKLNMIDVIDKQRLLRVIQNRNSHLYELWDLMSNITLGNGANALEYFHQYVKVLAPSGQVMSPQMGRIASPGATGVRRVLAEAPNERQNPVKETANPASPPGAARARRQAKPQPPAAE